MLVKCTLIWIWQCNQGPNWTVKLNSAVEHHLTILCQGWKKKIEGGRKNRRKKNHAAAFLCHQDLVHWHQGDCGWMVRDGRVWDGCVVHLSYRMVTEECSMKDGDYREGRQLLPGLSCDAPIHLFGTQWNKEIAHHKKGKRQTGCCLLYINQSGIKENHSPLLSEHGKYILNFPDLTERQMLTGPALALERENEHP